MGVAVVVIGASFVREAPYAFLAYYVK
jgi:hypothetical protein